MASQATDKRKGWGTPYGFGDFKEPVTYEEACEIMETITSMWRDKKPPEEGGESER